MKVVIRKRKHRWQEKEMFINAGWSPKPRLQANKRSVLFGGAASSAGLSTSLQRESQPPLYWMRPPRGSANCVRHTGPGRSGLSTCVVGGRAGKTALTVTSAIVPSLTAAEEKLARPDWAEASAGLRGSGGQGTDHKPAAQPRSAASEQEMPGNTRDCGQQHFSTPPTPS